MRELLARSAAIVTLRNIIPWIFLIPLIGAFFPATSPLRTRPTLGNFVAAENPGIP